MVQCLEFAKTQKVIELTLAKSSSNLRLTLSPFAQHQSYVANVSSSVSLRRKKTITGSFPSLFKKGLDGGKAKIIKQRESASSSLSCEA